MVGQTRVVAGQGGVDELDDGVLRGYFDAGSLARGRAYAGEGRVVIARVAPGQITATCRGSRSSAYLVRLAWGRRGGLVELEDECSCPLGGACKHGVATILTARRQAAPASGRARPEAAPVRRERAGPASPTVVPRREAPTWRTQLAGLDVGVEDGSLEGLALELAVLPAARNRWESSTDPRVTIRPMRRGKSGKWVRTGASWQDLSYGYAFAAVDPVQLAVLRSLATSYPSSLRYGGPAQVLLGQFGPDLWGHLARAVDAGVELVPERRGDSVSLSPVAAEVTLDLVGVAGGDLIATAAFTVAGEPLSAPDGEGGLLGSPAHGLWALADGCLRLFPLTAALHPTVRALVVGDRLRVPAADVEEFLDVYHAELARHARVVSSDASVPLPVTRFAGLAARIDRGSVDEARLCWLARYRRGDRVVDHPLAVPGGRGRDRAAEAAASAGVALPTHLLAGLAGPSGAPADLTVSGGDAVVLLTEVVPALEDAGVEVEVAGGQPELRQAAGDPLISLAVADGGGDREGNDWFDLQVEVRIDGETVDFAGLFVALDRGDEVLVLPSGTWLRLDRPELVRLRELIAEARGLLDPPPSATARLSPYQVDWWAELAGLGVVTEQSERWADNVARLAALTAPVAVPPPSGLDATLRPYQQDGLDWLAFLHRSRLGGILGDDMGLGKTVQVLALALHVLEEQPDARFLVVAPTSVVANWAREADRFAPGVTTRAITQTEARRGPALADAVDGAQMVVTSYALFRLEFDDYADLDWDVAVFDEAQFLKNHQSKAYQCARRLPARTKIAATGTPLENSLMDLWALLSLTAPGLYPDPKRFADTYRRPIESGQNPELLATLRRRIAPLLRRRTKDEVLTELPPKIEQVVDVELSPRHAKHYATQLQRERQKVLGLVGDLQRHRFEILKSLTLLRQLALAPGLVGADLDHLGSAKLDRLVEDVTQVVAEGHRALVFSQFTRFLGRARSRLVDAGIACSYLDGRTRKRDEAIARFKDGEAPVFLISLKAGGFGLNLTEADYCFVLDPWWNPATETQAVDRAHRIGQANPVVVYRYVSMGTIEEKVMELKARKADLFARVLDGGDAVGGPLDEADIRSLLDIAG